MCYRLQLQLFVRSVLRVVVAPRFEINARIGVRSERQTILTARAPTRDRAWYSRYATGTAMSHDAPHSYSCLDRTGATTYERRHS